MLVASEYNYNICASSRSPGNMPDRRYRRSELSQLAHELGMSYSEGDEYDLPGQLRDFRLFRRGRRRQVRHLLHRQDGMMDYDLKIMDYSYVRGKRKRPIDQTVFFLRSNAMVLPEFWMRPESLLHKVGELLGREDIDFERFPKFSGRYRLTGDDEVFIRHHFNEELLHFFSVERGWYLEGVGYYLLFYKKGKLLGSKKIKELYSKGMQVYKLLEKAT